ncbi:MAG: histidinol dehydrogenase, partial [Methanococcaceae archaeon]
SMRTINYNELSSEQINELLRRPSINYEKIFDTVKPIIDKVKNGGLVTAIEYAKKLDSFSGDSVLVKEGEFYSAEKNLSDEIKSALKDAYENIKAFHLRGMPQSFKMETKPGIVCSREFRAIENVGLYIPGGNAILPSTVLMLGIPAQIANCKRIVLSTPVKGGEINEAVLYAAKLCGINEIVKIGGAHAIALMAYGDTNFRKVNKIFGPGNQFVTAAKMLVSIDPSGCAIDMPAGPSELLIIADDSAEPSFIASDLLAQAEHGNDSQVILITSSVKFAAEVNKEIEKQLSDLQTKGTAEKSLENSFILLNDDITKALEFSNSFAPEHLILNIKNPEMYTELITNAGSVFLGQYSPESAGDYASGTNHSLPTSGYAAAFGGVSVDSFMKGVTFQQLSREGLKKIALTIETLAEAEGLFAHRNSVRIRFKK